jgi:hypothetical protein
MPELLLRVPTNTSLSKSGKTPAAEDISLSEVLVSVYVSSQFVRL